MILSMTGYGRHSVVFQGKKIIAEIKSVNSKALDLTARVATVYREKEMEVRSLIAQRVERGKVEFALWIEKEAGAGAAVVNKALVAEYYSQLKDVCATVGLHEPESILNTILRMPDVISRTEVVELTDEEWAAAHEAVTVAIDRLVGFRRQEGAALERKFEEKIDNIESLLKQIEPFEQSRVEHIRQRLEEQLANLKGIDYDRGRLEQEMIYYIEKLDINEEKQRLANHLDYFRQTLHDGYGQGKKLGFIAQEMGREINTTGSKSNQAEMQNLVVMMKDELEQIKEQVLNVM